MDSSSTVQAFQSASEFWAAADALRGLANTAASLNDLECGTPSATLASSRASPALSPSASRLPKGAGGISLMDDSEDCSETVHETLDSHPIVPIYLPPPATETQTNLPSLFARPSVVTLQNQDQLPSFRYPVLISHAYQSHESAWRYQELRHGGQDGHRHFQPLHSPVLGSMASPFTDRRPSVQSPIFLTPPVTTAAPMAATVSKVAPILYHLPMRASLREFKRAKQMHKCTWEGCTKEFAKPSLLASHLNIHNSIRPFSCSHCSASFSRNHDLRRHERCVHSMGAKEAHCKGCNKLFTRLDSCRFHEKTCHVVVANALRNVKTVGKTSA